MYQESGAEHAEEQMSSRRVAETPWKLRDIMTTDSAWSRFLRDQDLLWTRLPRQHDLPGTRRQPDPFHRPARPSPGPPPRVRQRPGTGAETRPHLGPAQRSAVLPPLHGRIPAARHDLPVLRRAIDYYLHFLTPGSDGKLHLPSTLSPEYPVVPPQGTNYDLALIRWGCQTLIDSAELLGIDDESTPRWQEASPLACPWRPGSTTCHR
jgi:hypothetical protein